MRYQIQIQDIRDNTVVEVVGTSKDYPENWHQEQLDHFYNWCATVKANRYNECLDSDWNLFRICSDQSMYFDKTAIKES